jgi:hypothetical protein
MNARNTNGTLLLMILAALLTLGVTACGGSETDTEDEGTTATDGEEFSGALPSADVVELSIGDEGTAAQGLTVVEQGLAGEPGALRQHAEDVLRGVNGLVRETHAQVDRLIESTEPVVIQQGNLECRQWEGDGERASWRLTVCALNRQAKHFRVLLEGKTLGVEGDYKAVFAGEGFRHKAEGERRNGRGRLGYNLDNLGEILGMEVSGKLGIGYRSAGQGRKLNLGFKGVQGPEFEQPLNAVYRFSHVRGRGGSFHFLTHRDLVLLDEAGEPALGQDGTAENARAAVVWSRAGAARGVFVVCGGTLGEGECVREAQCWSADGEVTFSAAIDGAVEWDRQACEPVPMEEIMPPAETDAEAPTEDAEGLLELPIPDDSGDEAADAEETTEE